MGVGMLQETLRQHIRKTRQAAESARAAFDGLKNQNTPYAHELDRLADAHLEAARVYEEHERKHREEQRYRRLFRYRGLAATAHRVLVDTRIWVKRKFSEPPHIYDAAPMRALVAELQRCAIDFRLKGSGADAEARYAAKLLEDIPDEWKERLDGEA